MFESRVSWAELHRGVGAATAGAWYVVDHRSHVLLVAGSVPTGAEAPIPADHVHLVGIDAGVPVWAVEAPPDPDLPSDGELVGLRQLYGILSEAEWGLAGRAAQIVAWDRDHRFCGRCGRPTVRHPTERLRACDRCRLSVYPRLTPAVIMLVERDDGRALLAWGRQFPARFFSALAGFVEPGESLEEAVAREVREEVGIEVDDIRYRGSQPWPFPNSLMIGFTARYAGGELVIQEEEIVEAGWFAPDDDLPPLPRGRMSIAGWLIDDWVHRASAAG